MVTPLGLDATSTWEALIAGTSGVAPITRFDASAHRTRIAGEVKGFDPERWIERKRVRETDRFTQFALAAGQMAWADAGLGDAIPAPQRDRMGCVIGSGMGGIESLEHWHTVLRDKGPGRISPYFVPATIANLAAGQLAMKLGLRGVNYCTTSACASGAHAIGEGFRLVQRGSHDVMVVGGAEAAVCPLGIAGFNAMLALSTRNDEPARASRPFDKGRDGFVMGEGSGVLVLEDRERALARGHRVYAEIVGYGATDDAHHLTQPAPEAEGAQRAMRQAFSDAGVEPAEVGYVNAHATSTSTGDAQELRAIAAVFGPRPEHLSVSATKSMTGHLLGAAGGIEAAFTVFAIHHGVLPPTVNLEDPDAAVDIDLVPLVAKRREVALALSNSFGFGGTNVALLFARH